MHFNQLEIHVVGHCNLNCRGCNHASPTQKRELISIEELCTDLFNARRVKLSSNITRILGGEPLLHPDIDHIIDTVKKSGITKQVHVVTNGTLLNRTSDEFWELVDAVQVSVYPTVDFYVPEEHEPKLHLNCFPTFNEAFSLVRHASREKIDEIWRRCNLPGRVVGIVRGRFYKCMRSAYISQMLLDDGCDGLLLATATADELMNYLSCREALRSCSFCTGSDGKSFPHQQVARNVWRKLQTRPVEEMLR